MEYAEFRGSINGKIIATFPLWWVDEILCTNHGTMKVRYYDQLDKANCEDNTKITEIEVNYINIK